MSTTKELLVSHRDALIAQRADLVAQFADRHADLDGILAQIETLKGQARAIVEELDVSEKPQLNELDAEISAVAKALGAYAMSDNAAE